MICRTRLYKSIDVYNHIFKIKIKYRYSIEDRGTDRWSYRQISILECTLKDLSNDIAMTRLSKLKISWRRKNNIPFPLH